MIDNFRAYEKWENHLSIKINFFSSRDSDEKHLMHSKSDNREIINGFDTDEIIG